MNPIIQEARAWVEQEARDLARIASAQEAGDRAFVRAALELDMATLLIVVTASADYRTLSVRSGSTDRVLAANMLRRAADYLEGGEHG